MRKIIAICLVFMFGLCACTFETSMTYTFNVETGDIVSVKLNTTGGYSITSNVPFELNKDDEEDTLMHGDFVTEDGLTFYLAMVDNAPNCTILEERHDVDNEYIFVRFDHEDYTEYDYIMHVGSSHTGMIFGCLISEDVARDCFSRLTISVVD